MAKMNYPFSKEKLYDFIIKAGLKTYAGGGKYLEKAESPGFLELEYQQGDFYYRDSYTGYFRSRGMEVVRFKGTPVWSALYGGGMVKGKESLAYRTFDFLKKALSLKNSYPGSFRGPRKLQDGNWSYRYQQDGDTEEFSGYEEINYQGELVFFHRVIGGIIRT